MNTMTDMQIESEIYSYFSSIANTANAINELSLHLNFKDQDKEILEFVDQFEDLIIKHRDSINSVLDLFVAYKQAKRQS